MPSVSACGEPLTLTPEDIARYSAVTWAAFDMTDPLACEAAPGHGGPHAALVQSSETRGRSYWALWETGRPYRIALLPACTVLRGDLDVSGDPVGCALYGCHGGGHIWTD